MPNFERTHKHTPLASHLIDLIKEKKVLFDGHVVILPFILANRMLMAHPSNTQ